MSNENFNLIFTQEVLDKLFPKERTDQFFDAIFGDAEEGAYDIALKFKGNNQEKLDFEFHLNQRPGKCLVCNLTHGLPNVFLRHPVLNIKGLIQEIDALLNGKAKCTDWQLGFTKKLSKKIHIIPFTVFLKDWRVL